MPYRFLNYGPQFFDSSGEVLAGGKLYFKASGSDTLQNTYQESGLTTANTNPIVLDSAGRATVNIFLDGTYRVELRDSSDTLIWQRDPVQNPVITGATSLADVLASGNITAANDIIVTSGQKITTNTVAETTAANGVSVDGVGLKDGGITLSSGGAFNAFKTESDMASNSATAVASQASIKAYVDTKVTAEDLDFQGDSGGAQSVDLDSQSLTVEGGTGIDTTGSAQKISVAIDSTVATLAGSQTLTNKTIDVDNNTLSNVETDNLKSGVLDTDLTSVSGSDDTLASAKAIKTYVDAQVTGEDLDFQGDSGGAQSVDLDSQSLTVEGGTGIDTTGSAQKVSIAIDSTVATLAGSQSLTNKTIDVDNNTLSNVEVDNLKSGVLDTDLASVSSSDDTLASAKAIKTYVDASAGSGELDVSDGTTTIAITLASETLGLLGGTGVTSTASGNNVTMAIGQDVATSAGVTFGSAIVTGDLTVDTSTFKVDSTNNRVGVLNASPDVSLDVGSATDAIHVSTGTTAQRPGSPAAGYFRFNSTLSQFEGHDGSDWGEIGGGGSGAIDIKLNSFTGNNIATAFTLSSNPLNENNTQVFLGGVYQEKDTYSVSGTTLTFSTAPPATDIEVMVYAQNSIGVPSDDSVSTVKIQDNAVTLAKMAGGTDGQIITYDASGDPIAVGPGTDGQVLTSTGAGSPPAFEDAAAGGGLTLVAVQTSGFTAAAGNQYLCNTSGGAFAIQLPSGSAGDTIGIIDYNGTFDTNNLTLTQSGSEKIFRADANGTIDTKNWSTSIKYMDATVGWLPAGG